MSTKTGLTENPNIKKRKRKETAIINNLANENNKSNQSIHKSKNISLKRLRGKPPKNPLNFLLKTF